MILVVNDACVLIDLIDADLFDEFLQLGYQYHITELVLSEVEGDYEKPVAQSIRTKTLKVYSLSGDDQTGLALMMRTLSPKLSAPDVSCLFLARKIGAMVLTADKVLRLAAKSLGLTAHGSLWVVDRLIEEKIITKGTARKKLIKLMTINPRIPKVECEKRLKRWR
ncbi:MAG: hypothetical protein ABIL58_08235 [Pseudomonadota bacterium]